MITEDEVMRLLERADPGRHVADVHALNGADYLATQHTRSVDMTLIDTESEPTAAQPPPSRRWLLPAIAAAAILAIVVGGLLLAARGDDPEEVPASPALGDLVTEEVEPGVHRVISDGAGHDLDERHPSYRYDMDGLLVGPDGTVWVAASYSRSDNEGKPLGGLVWAVGEPGITQLPDACFSPEGVGVFCIDENDEGTWYLLGTRITAVSVAPDGSVWATGDYRQGNGGLYRIERD